MALQSKCMFLKKPLETLLLAQTQRSLFVESSLKCPVLTAMLAKKSNNNLTGKCPFSSNVVLQTLTNAVNKNLHTSASQSTSVGKESFTSQTTSNNATKNVQEPTKEANISATFQNGTTGGFEYESFFNKMIQTKKDDHSYRIFRKVNRNAKNFPMAEDYTFSNEPKEITVWCSNDYLGMSRNQDVVNAAKNVIDSNGVGAGGTRNIAGTSLYHGKLEESLAQWHQKEAGLIFTSCFVANDTALYTLGQKLPGCIIFSDSENHVSMIHGIRTSGAKKQVFRHNDAGHLEELLKNSDPNVPKIVAFETVYSMTGAVCPLEELCDVAHKYGALTFVDEVHAVGLYGKHGSGIGEELGVLDKMDIISGTLGKAVGCIGGYLAGSASLIDTLRSYGSGFIFTTALPPDKVFAALTSLEILKGEEGQMLRQKHQANVKLLRTKLLQIGLPVQHSKSHIIPVQTCDPDKSLRVSQRLQQEHGIYVQSINYPTVSRGQEKLRIAPTPFHTEEMMDKLVSALDEIWRDVGLPYLHPVCEVNCRCQYNCVSFDDYQPMVTTVA